MKVAKNVAEYIALFPTPVQERLQWIRTAILSIVPEAEESISYGMPAYRYQGVLVYFGAYARHIGWYPTGSGISAFASELSEFKHAKGSVQFPHQQPLPKMLIQRMIRFRKKENEEKTAMKKKK
ncbi:MAG TPA: DUF1801 domain-containing protein [Chitinophagaceae bacterium]|nr:DUF1801 domain-containing protein [Chitinophagaceae bacterium]